MKMEMPDSLPGGDTIIYDDIETIAFEFGFDNTRDSLNGFYHMTKLIFRNGDKIAIVLFSNNERVPEIDGVDIEEGEDVIVFVDYFRFRFKINYITKDTFHNYKIRLKKVFLNFSLRKKSCKRNIGFK
jgi:hypothetical protein